jgi:hypothetical protein
LRGAFEAEKGALREPFFTHPTHYN